MTQHTDLAGLIEKLEGAEGGSRKLDWAVHCKFAPSRLHELDEWSDRFGCPRPQEDKAGWIIHQAPFTTSLDAALALVEEKLPGWGWNVGSPIVRPDRGYYAAVFNDEMRVFSDVGVTRHGETDKLLSAKKRYFPTPAIALLIALLRAMEAQND